VAQSINHQERNVNRRSTNTLAKWLAIIISFLLIGIKTAQARPEYLAIYAADPYARPELRAKCSVCHLSPEGGSERNAFGKAFAAAGLRITPELRKRFPDRFTLSGSAPSAPPPVTFVKGSDSQAIVEINGKQFLIDTRAQTVVEVAPGPKPNEAVAAAPPPPEPKVYRPVDVRLVNLPTAMPVERGSLWVDFTHRFPFGEPSDAAELFGLDSFAVPSFGFTYGVTDRIQVGAYRASSLVGRPILVFAGASLTDERKGHPFTALARVGAEGRDNFQRNFTTSFELAVARSVTRHAQLYFVPTVSLGDRPLGATTRNLPGETAVAFGVGGAVNLRPSVALMAEANYRFNEAARYLSPGFGIRRPVFGFGIQKASISRRHSFSLVFTNGPGTTFAQRSMTRGLLFADDAFQGLTIGFNLTRRLF
jgi:hypothetical protein